MSAIRTVLCPVDFTSRSDTACDLAVAVCRRFGARLVLEHNVDPGPPSCMAVSWMWSEDHESEEEEKARAAGKKLEGSFSRLPSTVRAEGRLTRGPIDLTLLHLARELPADLLVMATHGPSTAEHKSVTEGLIVEAPCPVLTIPEACHDVALTGALTEETGEAEEAGAVEVLVPVEFEPHSVAAAGLAFRLARQLPLRLRLLHVESPRRGEEAVERDEGRLRDLVPHDLVERVEVEVETAAATVDEILDVARRREAWLMVVGTHPKGTVSRFFSGATSFELLHQSDCPVWFVPAGSVPARDPSESAGAAG